MEISLSGLLFHAFHGLYEEEKKLGGDFEVNLSVSFHPVEFPVIQLQETIDYSRLYDIVKEVMATPKPLIETVLISMAAKIFDTFSIAEETNISITKINPPVISFRGKTTVSARFKKNELSLLK